MANKKIKSGRFGIMIEPDILKKFKQMAVEENRSYSAIVRQLIKNYVDKKFNL